MVDAAGAREVLVSEHDILDGIAWSLAPSADEIGSDYAQAWPEFEGSGDAEVWDAATGDGVAE